jgi:hypothetical protein
MQIWLEQLTLKTQEIVDDNWIYIEKLANILIEKEQVDGKVLDDMFFKKIAKELE